MNDQNWYLQNDPQTRRPKSYLWLWLLLGFICVAVAFLGGIWWLANMIRQQGGVDQWARSINTIDDTEPAILDSDQLKQRLQTVRLNLNQNARYSVELAEDDIALLDEAVGELVDILAQGDDDRFSAFLDHAAFNLRVRESGLLSSRASSQFTEQFQQWMAYYTPVVPCTASVYTVAAGENPSQVVVYTWLLGVYDYPEAAAWYFVKRGQRYRLIDYSLLDQVELESEKTAREFSAAFTELLWDNYIQVMEADYSSLEADSAAEEITRLADLTLPQSVSHQALLHLVQTADDLGNNQLAVDLLDRIAETTDMPAIDFGRARHHYRLEHYEQALRALEQYSARMGDGPGTLQLRADIMTGLERTDEVRHAWLGLMKYYPELDLLPWDYHEVFQPQHAQDIADAAGRSQQPRLAACHIASRLILLGRAELVEPLAVLARSTDQTYPELLVLEGALLEHQGDSEGNIEMLRRAMDLAGPEHQEYGVWLYDWAWALFNLDRAAEAVRLSPDPAMTFADLALDEGDVYVDRETLRQLTEALNESQPANQSAVERRLLWIPLATGLNHLQHGRYEDAWTVLSTFRSQHQNPDDPLYSDDTAAAYMVPSWLAEAAVKSGHAVEAYKTLRDDEGRFGLLAYVAEQQELADVLDQIIDLQRQESVDDDEVTYYEGVSFELRKQYEQAISKYMDYLNGDEEVRYKDYRAGTRLARLAWRESAWDLLFERLTADQVVSTLGDLFQQRNRADLMQQLLERGQTAGVDDEIIRPHRTWMLHQQQNWAALIEDYQKWLAAGAAQQEGDSPVYLGTGPYISHYVDALIADNRLTELEQLMATLEETSGWSRWFSRARVVQSTSDQYLESTEGDDAAGVLPLNHVQDHPSTAAKVRSEAWREVRQQFPISSYGSVINRSGEYPSAIFLFGQPVGADMTQLAARLSEIDQVNSVQDLSSAYRAQIDTYSQELPANRVAEMKSGGLFRLVLDHATVVVAMGNDQFHQPGVGSSPSGNKSLPADLRQTLNRHQGWLSIQLESVDGTLYESQQQSLFSSLVAQLWTEDAILLKAGYELAPIVPEVKEALQAGTCYSLPQGRTAYFERPAEWKTAAAAANRKRQKSFRQHLNQLDPAQDDLPVMTVLFQTAAGAVPLQCRLRKWDTRGQYRTMTVELPDDVLVAPDSRGEWHQLSIEQFLDWSE